MPDTFSQIASTIDSYIDSKLEKYSKDYKSYVKNYKIGSEQLKPGAVIPPKLSEIPLSKINQPQLQEKINTSTSDMRTAIRDAQNDISLAETRISTAEGSITDIEGNVSLLQTTASTLTSDMSDAKGNISTLQQTAQSLSSSIADAEGNISSLQQSASEMSTTLGNAEGDISSLKQRADGIESAVANVEGDVSLLEQTATTLTTAITNADGEISSLQQTAQGLTTIVSNAQDDISTLQQTTNGLTTSVTNALGSISTLEQRADGLTTSVTNVEGDITALQQTTSGISTLVTNAQGDISTLQQTASSHSSSIADAQGNISTLQQTASDLTFSVGQKLDATNPSVGVQTSGISITSGKVSIETPTFTVEIPGAEEGEEKLRINADGAHFPQIESPTVARRVPGGVYTVYNNADFDTLADAFDALDGATLDGDVVLKLGRDDAGGTLRAVWGGRVIITSGNLIYRHAKRVQNAEFATSGSYGYRVNCPAGGAWSRAIIEVGRVGDLGLAGKDVTIKVGTITNSGATFVGASLYLLDADYQSNELHLQTLNFSDEEKTAVVPADTDDDRILCVMLQLSRGEAAAAGSNIIYDGLRVEIGGSVYGWATAQYKIADFEAVNCDRVTLSRLTLPAGVRLRAGRATITRCELYGQIGVLADQAQVRMSDNAGACAKAVKAMGGMVHVTGSAPGGAYEGWLIDTSTAQISGSGSAPTEQTKTLTANATGTYGPSSWWSSDRAIRQGYTPSNGRLRGGMWWDLTAIPAGATVTGMRLTIKRTSGFGKGDNVTLKAYGTASNARSGQPALTMGPYTLGEINNGQTKTFDLPAALASALAAGTAKGIVLYADDTSVLSGKTYSTNYARFDGTDGTAPKLAVTFTV